MLFGDFMYPTVRFGADFRNQESYGTVRYVFRYGKSYGAVLCCDKYYGAVRCCSPLNGFCFAAGPIAVGKTVQKRDFVRFMTLFLGALTKPLFLYGAPYEQTVQKRDFVRFLTIFLGALTH